MLKTFNKIEFISLIKLDPPNVIRCVYFFWD